MVTMGFIDPDDYLGGRVQLKPELSREALDGTFGERFGWSTEEAAAAVHDLVVVNMANAVREVSVGKGHDPREFLFLAYGGTLPLFASQIAERLGITKIVIPQNSSVFCALGLLSADFVMRNDQGVGWDLSKPDGVGRGQRDRRRRWSRRRARRCCRRASAEDQIEIQRSARLPLPRPGLRAHGPAGRAGRSPADDADALGDRVHARSTSAPTARARRGRACRSR